MERQNHQTQMIDNVVEKAGEEFRARAKDVAKTAREVTDRATEQWDDTREWVKKNPGRATGITLIAGAAIGALATLLLSRRSSTPFDGLQRSAAIGQERWKSVREAILDGISEVRGTIQDVRSALRS